MGSVLSGGLGYSVVAFEKRFKMHDKHACLYIEGRYTEYITLWHYWPNFFYWIPHNVILQ